MDVHKESISIATAGEGEEVRHYGTGPNYLDALDSGVSKLVGTGHTPYFVYEAGSGGYTIYWHLRDNGLDCMVAAPSLIPSDCKAQPSETSRMDRRMLIDRVQS
jgi:hypothetical protein